MHSSTTYPHPKAFPLINQFTPKLHKLPQARPATRQNAASVPATSFSSSSIAGLNEGEEARIMDKLEMYLSRGSDLPLDEDQ